MKNALKFLSAIILLMALNACKKDAEAEIEKLSTDDLTNCPEQSVCNFYFANYAGMNGNQLLLTNGQYRVFWAQTSAQYNSFTVYIMAPMTGDRFEMNKEDIIAGRVKYISTCASCFAVSMVPIDGKIIGERVKQSAGLPEKWLVQADLTVAAGGDAKYSTAARVKQYFLPAN